MCKAHDGGASAPFCRYARRPLSRSLMRSPTPPIGRARTLKDFASPVPSLHAQPPCPSKSPAHDRRGDASVVQASPDAQFRHGVSPPVSDWRLHRRLRVSPCAALHRSGRRSARHDGSAGIRCSANRMVERAGLRSAAFYQPRCVAAHGCSARSDRRYGEAAHSRAQSLIHRADPSVARSHARHLPLAGEDGQRTNA